MNNGKRKLSLSLGGKQLRIMPVPYIHAYVKGKKEHVPFISKKDFLNTPYKENIFIYYRIKGLKLMGGSSK